MKHQSLNQYAEALMVITENKKKSKELDQVLSAFVQLLAKKHLLSKVENIIKAFIAFQKKRAGIRDVALILSRPVKDEVLNKITAAFGRKVESTVEVNSEILGGFIAKTDDSIYDASLRIQLQKLQEHLIM